MRSIALYLSFLLPGVNLFGQATEKGYYITWKNDTVHAKIMVASNNCGMMDGFQIVDSNKKKLWILPTEAKECVYTYRGKEYRFFSIPEDQYRKIFLGVDIIGPKVKLYKCVVNLGPSLNHTKVFYNLEKRDGKMIRFDNFDKLEHITDLFTQFFKSDPPMIEEVKKRFKNKKSINDDVKSIVESYNEMK
jgi:hypothetical protein